MSLAIAFNYFANSLWQVPLLVLCCWCALRLARASARLQYAAWVLTLLLAVALPVRGIAPAQVNVNLQAGNPIDFPAFKYPLPPDPLPFYAVRISPRTRDLLAGFYLLLTTLALLRLAVSHLSLRRLVRSSVPYAPTSEEQERLPSFLHPTNLRVLPPGHAMPMVAGVFRPVLLLPAFLLAGKPEPLQAVLAHELEHIRRRDTLTNLLLHLAALPVAYHPATAFLQRRIQHARELLCDAIAARALPSSGAYAHVLLGLAQRLLIAGGDPPHSTVGLFQRTSKPLLEDRIMNLIAPLTPLRPASRLLRLTGAAAMLGAAIAATSFVHLTPAVLAAEHPVRTVAATPVAPIAAQAQALSQSTPAGVLANRSTAAVTAEAKDVQHASDELTGQALQQQSADLAQVQAELSQLQAQIHSQTMLQTRAEIEKSMQAMRAQLSSPEFSQQMAAARAQVAIASTESAATRKQVEELRRQLDSPEFKRQLQVQTADALRLQTMLSEQSELLASSATQAAGPVRISGGVMAGQILTKVAPVYPPDAKAAGISGAVVLHAVIDKDGTIGKLEVISGPQVLQSSALEAVRQWTYKPYLLNGEPTEVENNHYRHVLVRPVNCWAHAGRLGVRLDSSASAL